MAWFGVNDLRRLAGEASYERGLGYLNSVGDCDETCRALAHPADAIPVYRAAVDQAIEFKNRSAYADAAALLLTLRDLYRRTDQPFDAYLAELRSTHRRKRTFLNSTAPGCEGELPPYERNASR